MSISKKRLTVFLLGILVTACSSNNESTDNTSSEPGPPAEANLDLTIACSGDRLDMQEAILHLVNTTRAEARMCGNDFYPVADPVTWNDDLRSAAINHSADMAQMNFFAHTGSNGLQVTDRADAAGYNWQAVGENIAGGQPDTQSVMDEWIASPGHCANIMSTSFTETATACWENPNSNLEFYWTSVFGNSL